MIPIAMIPAFMHYEQPSKNNRATSAASHIDPGASMIAPSATFVDDVNASIRYMEGAIKLGQITG